MSNSFPNSWEPYGSQQSGMNWRKPATRPAQQTLSDRWKNAQAKVLQPPFSRPSPTPPVQPTPKPTLQPPKGKLDLATFQRADAEHRLLARYEAVRTEIREVGTSVKVLSDSIDCARERDDVRNKGALDEIRGLQDGLSMLNEQLKVVEKGDNEAMKQNIRNIVEEIVKSLKVDVQALSKKVDRVDECCRKVAEDVNELNDDVCEKVGKHVVEGVEKLINGGVAKVEEGAKTMFDDNIEIYEMVLERIEDIVKPLYDRVSYQRDDYEELNKEGRAMDGFTLDRGSTNEFSAAGEPTPLSPERWPATEGDKFRAGCEGSSTRGESADQGCDGRVWAKVRIRPVKKVEVIDLTGDSVGEEDPFEEDLRGLGTGVKVENDLLVDDVEEADSGKRKIRKRGRCESRYFTRSVKKRFC